MPENYRFRRPPAFGNTGSGKSSSKSPPLSRLGAQLRAWCQEQHAKLLHKPPARQEKVALAQPRPLETPG